MAKHTDDDKRAHVKQSEFPNGTLAQALRIPRAIWDNFAGGGAAPHQIAMALDMSPTSGTWRNLCGSAIAYGLTEGGYNAVEIVLTDLGRRIVAPTDEGDDHRALVDALLKPRILREFFSKYDRAKFPRDDIAKNVLVQMGLPKERADAAFDILKANGDLTGIIQQTKTGPFVALQGTKIAAQRTSDTSRHDNDGEDEDRQVGGSRTVGELHPSVSISGAEGGLPNGGRVFITHGKNIKILDQIKRAVVLGGFQPIISVQIETAAKPVPQKVLDDMRSCGAAVIHVAVDDVKGTNGDGRPAINPNVLIEIGAAMALYKDRFILVAQNGLDLPSNLQGLYQCRYDGEGLDWDAGMKILEALRGLARS